jgi:hypothetical protein
MAIAPSILLHSSPRGRLQLAFQSVVPGLVEAALLFAEQLDEVVGRGGEVGRLLGRGRFHRQPGGRDDLSTAHQLGRKVGRAAACRALNVPRASLYRDGSRRRV